MQVDMTTLPQRMKKLPIDEKFGVPVPWFVDWLHGKPEFRAMDRVKFRRAIKERLCWVCGEPLGRWLAFPIGPMCAVTRTTSEPPCHRECAEWSMKNCPFLSDPRMERRTDGLPEGVREAPGIPINRNPGVMCLWMTRQYETFPVADGRLLITVGTPEQVTWWREGREATREEVQASLDSGVPVLLAGAKTEGRFAVEALGKQVAAVEALLPPTSTPPPLAEAVQSVLDRLQRYDRPYSATSPPTDRPSRDAQR